MDFVVLNGSPKSEYSVTLYYVKYLEKKFPEHNFIKHHVSKNINRILEKNELFDSIIEDIEQADGVIWSTPVYTLLVPSQLMQFIKQVFEKDCLDVFEGKYSTAITASANFYDHTAHNYLRAISEDWGMKFFEGFSAEMYDLEKKEKRSNLLKFGERFLHYVKNDLDIRRYYEPISDETTSYKPEEIEEVQSSDDYNILLISDAAEKNRNLKKMIDVFVKSSKYQVDHQNLLDINIEGGCLGCMNCTQSKDCVYEDHYEEFHRKKIMPSDGIIFASKIENRFLSPRFKQFFDRAFCFGHCPLNKGKQVGYILSGPLRKNKNLKQVLKGKNEVGRTNLAGIVTDEPKESSKITNHLQQLSNDFAWGLENSFIRPRSFLGEGGHKIFRDLIYNMKAIFTGDHKFYKEHDLYDFPQRQYKTRIQNFFINLLSKIPGSEKMFKEKMQDKMIEPLEEAVEEE